MGLCLQCKTWVNQTKGKRAKKFCNDTCRSNYRHAQNKKKAANAAPIADEKAFPVNKAKKEPQPQKSVMEWEAELEGAEDVADLERIGRQIERSSLWWKDKQYLKSRGMAIYQQKFAF